MEIRSGSHRNGSLEGEELHPEVEKLHIMDDMAVITLTMKLKGKFNDLPFEGKYRYIRFRKKLGDGIKVVGGSGIAVLKE